ncbi:MAG TPA: Rpn family recombination-promoting nuclease/putative transposase [Alphaproteobacteria bacterium]|nr:Rpn family recombination-promoting nuclease/putative transposase [Alphaproteobacteria bacterium]HQS94376.1 Rpn family recombination-promoting nuclease/putative transposase [Alphaproteobacteria bacterium]
MPQKLSPHDRFTRASLTHPKVAEEFFQKNLPEKIKKMIDFSSLKLNKESFIDDHLKLQISDMLFSVNFNENPGFIYLLVEHASTPQPLLPFRMLKYVMAIMEDHLKRTKSRTLPFVFPLVLYTGKKAYPYSMDLFDLFSKEERMLAKETLHAPYPLIDLSQATDEEFKKYLWFGSMGLLLKHIHDGDILPFFKRFLDLLKQIEKQGETRYIYTVISYIAIAGKLPDKEGFFLQAVKDLETVDEEETMQSLAEYLNLDVFKIGFEKGRKEEIKRAEQERLKVEQKLLKAEQAHAKAEQERAKAEQECVKSQLERLKLMKVMFSKGMSLETISDITGYSQKELKLILT